MIRFVKTDVNKTTFEQKIAAGNAKNEDIVLLPNEKKIWSNGTFYDCDSEEALKSSKAYTDSNISTVNSSLTSHTQNKSNPHNVTKSDVGLGNVTNDSQVKRSEMGAASGVATLDANSKINQNIDASKITSGTISIDRLPQGALERLTVVANAAARKALTTANVQNGDTVKETDTGLMYYVKDDTKLNQDAGWEVYTAGSASSVPWSGVTGKPNSFTPSEHTHNQYLEALSYNASDVLAKIKTVDGGGSGLDADLLDGYHYSQFPFIKSNTYWAVNNNSSAPALNDNTEGLSQWAFGEIRNPAKTYIGILKPSVSTCGITAHGTIVVFGEGDTHLGIATDYSRENFQVFGGNQDKIVWRKSVAFTDSNVASANKLQTARTITIGNTGKNFDGTANVSWSLAEIGALPVAGGVMTGNLILRGTASEDMTFTGNVHPRIRFDENGVQPVDLIYTDYDSYRSPAGIKLVGSQGGEWFEAPNIYATNFYGALSGNATSASKLATARTITIGNTGKNFNGTENVSWSLAEIGAILSESEKTDNKNYPIYFSDVETPDGADILSYNKNLTYNPDAKELLIKELNSYGEGTITTLAPGLLLLYQNGVTNSELNILNDDGVVNIKANNIKIPFSYDAPGGTVATNGLVSISKNGLSVGTSTGSYKVMFGINSTNGMPTIGFGSAPMLINSSIGGNITCGGNLEITASGGYLSLSGKDSIKANKSITVSSDLRNKQNIKTVSKEDLEKLSSVEYKSFEYKDEDNAKTYYGVIAQELSSVGIDGLVIQDRESFDDEGNKIDGSDYYSVDYNSLYALEIANLKKLLKELKEEILLLKAILND